MKKKSRILIYPLLLTGIILVISSSCKKDNSTVTFPMLTTAPLSNITQTTASCGGNIINDGGSVITGCGVCWAISPITPTIVYNKTNDGLESNSFTSSITGLVSANTYFIRAFATNSNGKTYGNLVEFTTH